jgi:signal transduction histidine kinase/DNA-binding response OmpR family regulator
MKNTRTSTGIKKKIVAGFLILLTLIFVSVLSVIKISTKLSPPDPGLSSSVAKLTITSNLLSSIVQSDGHARAFINTGDSIYFDNYNFQDKVTRQLIDSLILTSISNTNQYLRILIVDSLLDLKRTTFNNFFILRNKNQIKRPVDFGRIVLNYSDSVKVPNRTISKIVTHQYPTAPEKKTGFLSRIWSGITGKKKVDSTNFSGPVLDVKYDTVLTYKAVRDTTLSQVKTQLKKIEERENLARQQANEREMMLIRADMDIMNEIRAVLLLYEKEEIEKAIKVTEKSRALLDNLWYTAFLLAALGLLATAGFIIMIWKDLARSAFYRRQSEEARALAESLLKVKEQFLANMSHEIRTPLTSIIGFSERLSETSIDQEQSRYVRYITSSSEHLLELINDLLDFSRIGSGKLTLDARSFNLSDLFEEAFETLAPKAKEKGLEVILKQNINPDQVIGDPLRLRQIVINLLNNSIKFTDKGKVMLQTKAIITSDQKNVGILIRVADTGIGIPADKQEYIFEEFSQVDHSITRKYGGSGLGLAITKRLVEMMDGTIAVHSRSNQGTIFTVKLSLPISETKDVTSDSEREIPKIKDLKNVGILLAEDDDTTRVLIAEFLEKYNAEVITAINGIEALDLFKKEPSKFRILITDIQMPGISGIELIDQIQLECIALNLQLPAIIGLTAHASDEELRKYKSSGIDYFILKPFKNSEIIKALNLQAIMEEPTQIKKGSLVNSQTRIQIPEHTNNISTLDFSSFRKFAGDDEESLSRIISSLETNILNTSDEMLNAFNKHNYSEVSVLAHRLIPNIKLLGAKSTADDLRKVEVICKSEYVNAEELTEHFNSIMIGLNDIRIKLRNTHFSSNL